jgi:hypothetical protein
MVYILYVINHDPIEKKEKIMEDEVIYFMPEINPETHPFWLRHVFLHYSAIMAITTVKNINQMFV